MRPIVGLVLLAGISAANFQQPLSTSSFREAEADEYQFSWPIQRVAVIGAGPSGLVAYRELTEAGLDVCVFERDSVPGGNWHYTEGVPLDAPVPNAPTAIGDFVPSLPPATSNLPYSEELEDDGELRRDHRGPKPIWESLASNAPSPLQQVSGSEISRDLNHQARKVYQSFRAHNASTVRRKIGDTLRRVLKNTTLVGEIKQFLPIPEGSPIQSGLVELKNGTILSGIDSVILATGFRYSFPFLPQYYDGATYVPHKGSASTVSPFLPLDGLHVRDSYLNLFYIRDPTLVFLGVTMGTPMFSFTDYTALVLAKVWTNRAKLPSIQTMHAWYEKCVEERGGYGKYALYLDPEQSMAHFTYLIGWLNQAAVEYGGKQVDGLPKYSKEVNHYWQIAHFGVMPQESVSKEDEVILASLGLTPRNAVDHWTRNNVLFYDDDW